MFEENVMDGLMMVLIFSAIPLGFSSFVGLMVSIIQAATQVQEQSLSFFVKFLSISGALFFLCPWFLREYQHYFEKLVNSFVVLGYEWN